MKTDPNDYAYPWEGESRLTKRELFAAMAMQGLISNGNLNPNIEFEKLAKIAVAQADALIAALNEEGAK